jgi:predicted transglutaminase-like protease
MCAIYYYIKDTKVRVFPPIHWVKKKGKKKKEIKKGKNLATDATLFQVYNRFTIAACILY